MNKAELQAMADMLSGKMDEAVAAWDFELAAELRDKIVEIEGRI